jgi:hypothetical protein
MKDKNNAIVTRESDKITIDLTPKQKFISDPLFPWVKKSTKYRVQDPVTLFGRYIGFYDALIVSGTDQNIIITSQILELGKEYNLSGTAIENCIKDLVVLNVLIKVKRGVYMLNPKNVSGGKTAEASTDLIKQAEGLTQINNYINVDSGTLTEMMVNKKFPGLLDGL